MYCKPNAPNCPRMSVTLTQRICISLLFDRVTFYPLLFFTLKRSRTPYSKIHYSDYRKHVRHSLASPRRHTRMARLPHLQRQIRGHQQQNQNRETTGLRLQRHGILQTQQPFPYTILPIHLANEPYSVDNTMQIFTIHIDSIQTVTSTNVL